MIRNERPLNPPDISLDDEAWMEAQVKARTIDEKEWKEGWNEARAEVSNP